MVGRVAVDLDGTLVVPGTTELLPDAARAVRRLSHAHTIILHSCYVGDRLDAMCSHPVMRKVDFTVWHDVGKPVADVYVDDKALRFTGNWRIAERQIREILKG